MTFLCKYIYKRAAPNAGDGKCITRDNELARVHDCACELTCSPFSPSRIVLYLAIAI